MTNVATLTPKRHYQIDIWEARNGYIAEAHVSGDLLWEYRCENMASLLLVIKTMLERIDDTD